MKLPVYAIRDVKANAFQQLTVASNDAVIVRSFAESIYNKRDSIMSFSPKDFDLYRIGVFNTETGIVEPESPVVLVVNAQEVLSRYAD